MYRTIDAAFWTDAKLRRLSANDRYLFLYLITNPHTHVSGLYYLPMLIARHETGLSARGLMASLNTLSKARLCLFDLANELVWVVKMFRFQGKGEKNTLSAAHHISKDIHKSFLISEFLAEYPDVKTFVKIPYPELAEVATPEQEQENGTGTGNPPYTPPPDSKLAAQEFSESFLGFWKNYPKRVGKGAAWKAWRNLKPSADLVEQIEIAVKAAKNSRAWTRENGQYIPHPSTWLNKRQWEDDTESLNLGSENGTSAAHIGTASKDWADRIEREAADELEQLRKGKAS